MNLILIVASKSLGISVCLELLRKRESVLDIFRPLVDESFKLIENR